MKYKISENFGWNRRVPRLLNLVGQNKFVLEGGCYNGGISRHLSQQGCKVIGVELFEDVAKEAATFCEKVIVGNIEKEEILNQIFAEYDVILLADIIEHLIDPEQILKKLKKMLKKNGYIVVSIPNIAYWEVRKNLLLGKFDYTETGILDKTHLHFYTRESAYRFFKQCELEVEEFYTANGEIPFERLFNKLLGKNNFIKRFFIERFPECFGYQMIFKLIKA